MKKGPLVLGLGLTTALVLAVGYRLSEEPLVDPVEQGTAPGPVEEIYKVPIGDSPIRGPEGAMVTIVEFSDFECPYCGKVNSTLRGLENAYSDKVRLVFKHIPLKALHPNAELAADYAVAAHQQGKFWALHDEFFRQQNNLEPENLDRYANQAGVDVPKLKEFIESGRAAVIRQSDQYLAMKLRVESTPTFFINGIKLTGNQPYTSFQKIVDEQIEKAERFIKAGVPREKLYAKFQDKAIDEAEPEALRPKVPRLTRQKVELVDDTPAIGSREALVTIVEFVDFECPYSARAVGTIRQLIKEYPNELALHYRAFPLAIHENAETAAKAAQAAHMQGQFWMLHEAMFNRQEALSVEEIERYANIVGLDVKRLRADMESEAVKKRLEQDIADGKKYGVEGTPAFFINGVPVTGAQPINNFRAVIEQEIGRAKKLIADGVDPRAVYQEVLEREGGKEAEMPQKIPEIEIGRAPYFGSPDASVKVVLFSDFECPFCSRVMPHIDQLKKEYGQKIQIAFKNFPLPFHRNAEDAAIAALAAHRQGKFWEMHDRLFAHQKELQRTRLVEHAKAIGLDVTQFEKDLNDNELWKWVQQDKIEGEKAGVEGTPATFINGRMILGSPPYTVFKQAVDEALRSSSS